jgi:hypothetical protein
MAEYANPPLWSAPPADGFVPVYDAATDRLVPTAIASIGSPLTVPQVHPAEATQSAIDAPAGGVGAAAGAWDTSAHRDAAIATINDTVTDVAALITWADALQALLITAGILS